jgi:hypothetical protein
VIARPPLKNHEFDGAEVPYEANDSYMEPLPFEVEQFWKFMEFAGDQLTDVQRRYLATILKWHFVEPPALDGKTRIQLALELDFTYQVNGVNPIVRALARW